MMTKVDVANGYSLTEQDALIDRLAGERLSAVETKIRMTDSRRDTFRAELAKIVFFAAQAALRGHVTANPLRTRLRKIEEAGNALLKVIATDEDSAAIDDTALFCLASAGGPDLDELQDLYAQLSRLCSAAKSAGDRVPVGGGRPSNNDDAVLVVKLSELLLCYTGKRYVKTSGNAGKGREATGRIHSGPLVELFMLADKVVGEILKTEPMSNAAVGSLIERVAPRN